MMESSSDHNPESNDHKSSVPPRQEAEGRFSVASSSSTSSFNSIVNTSEEMGIMEDDEDDNVVGRHKPNLPPISPQNSDRNLTTPAYTTADGIPGYDANRIPASVFARKPTNRMEWSVASNDSLFSIQMGNNSFSMGPDIVLPFEVNNEVNAPSGLPTTAEEDGVDNSNRRTDSISSELKEEDHSMIPNKDTKNHSFEITHAEEPMIPLSTGGNHGDRCHSNHVSTVSRESGTSSSSFAFPLLASESGTKKTSSAAAPEQPVTAIEVEEANEKSKSGQETTVPEGAEAGAATGAGANQPNNNGAEKKSSWLSCFSCFTNCSFNCKTPNHANCFAKGNDKVDA